MSKKTVTIKKPTLQLSVNLLLIGVISALFALFAYMLSQRPAKDYFVPAPAPTIKPVTTSKELDTMLDEINKDDANAQISTELTKLSTDSSGI